MAIESIIVLPADKRGTLQAKLKEYKGRLAKAGDVLYRKWDATCKIAVLQKLLQDGQLDIQSLAAEMMDVHKDEEGFSTYFRNSFETACGVINDYCETGGENCHGGTGLPEVPELPAPAASA